MRPPRAPDRRKDARVLPAIEPVRARLDAAIFALVACVTALSVVPFGSVDPWWEGACEGVVFALGALWAVEGAFGRRWLVAEHRLLLPVVALVVYALVQTLPLGGVETRAGVEVRASISADPFETLRFAVKLAALTLAAALWLRYTSNAQRLRAAVLVIVGAGVASALFGFARQAMSPEGLADLSLRLGTNRDGFAQFINRNHFALLMEMTFGLALGLSFAEATKSRRLFLRLAVAALPVWAALVLSGSRGGILGMLAGLIFFTLVSLSSLSAYAAHGGRANFAARWAARARDSLIVRAALVACLSAVVLVGVVWVGGERIGSRLDEMSGAPGTDAPQVRWGDSRLEIWRATLGVIRERPLFGVGFGAYRAGIPPHHDASGEMSLEQAHNDYLELAASGGVVGACLAVWAFITFIIHARRRLREADFARRAVVAGALAGLFAAAIHGLFDFGLHVTANAFVFTALAAIVAAGVQVTGSSTFERGRASRHARPSSMT